MHQQRRRNHAAAGKGTGEGTGQAAREGAARREGVAVCRQPAEQDNLLYRRQAEYHRSERPLYRHCGQNADHHQRLHDQRRSEQRRLQAGHCHLSGRQHDLQRHGQDAERHRHAGGTERGPAPVRHD